MIYFYDYNSCCCYTRLLLMNLKVTNSVEYIMVALRIQLIIVKDYYNTYFVIFYYNFCGVVTNFPNNCDSIIFTCPSTIFSKGYTVSIIAFIFPLLVHLITSSNPARVPCVLPKRFNPLKKRYLRSIFESYPVVLQ